jgi:hypothetical protein
MKNIAFKAAPAAILAAGSFVGQAHATTEVVNHTYDLYAAGTASYDVLLGSALGQAVPQFRYVYSGTDFEGVVVKPSATFQLALSQTGYVTAPGGSSQSWARFYFGDSFADTAVPVGFQINGADYVGTANFDLDTDNNTFTLTTVDYDAVASAVPEPATWVAMILGMGAVGFGMRRSRRGQALETLAA